MLAWLLATYITTIKETIKIIKTKGNPHIWMIYNPQLLATCKILGEYLTIYQPANRYNWSAGK